MIPRHAKNNYALDNIFLARGQKVVPVCVLGEDEWLGSWFEASICQVRISQIMQVMCAYWWQWSD